MVDIMIMNGWKRHAYPNANQDSRYVKVLLIPEFYNSGILAIDHSLKLVQVRYCAKYRRYISLERGKSVNLIKTRSEI